MYEDISTTLAHACRRHFQVATQTRRLKEKRRCRWNMRGRHFSCALHARYQRLKRRLHIPFDPDILRAKHKQQPARTRHSSRRPSRPERRANGEMIQIRLFMFMQVSANGCCALAGSTRGGSGASGWSSFIPTGRDLSLSSSTRRSRAAFACLAGHWNG